jgi:hypothetical protein
MTVRELIVELSAIRDQSADVVFDDGEDDGCDITGIEVADENSTVYLLSEDEEGDEEEQDESNVIDVDFKAIPA